MALQGSNHSLVVVDVGRPVTASPARAGAARPTASGVDRRSASGRAVWAVAVTSLALFMVTLDNLVVTTALPVIKRSLHAGLGGLEWTVNAYTLTFAVLLLTGAALGDRFGRRRMFLVGLVMFTVASAAAAVSPSIGWLVTARAVQGAGGALVMPLSLTLLSAAVSAERRTMALGIWGAVGGIAVAAGPVVGGAVTTGWSWQYIFWLNVPVGVILVLLARWRLAESTGPSSRLDIGGVVLATVGLFGVVLGLVRANAHGWSSVSVVASFVAGAIGLVCFVGWESRAKSPMLPLKLFRRRAFSAVNVVALLMSFGMFGSIFFLSQFLQVVQHYSPFAAGLRVLPWTGMPMLLAPVAAWLAQRFGGRLVLSAGLVLQAVGLAWLAAQLSPTVSYGSLWLPFVVSGMGMALFFVPLASVVLSSVSPASEGVASGANNAFREIGGVIGIAALGAVFAARGGYASGAAYVHGLRPAVWVGVAVVALGAAVALVLPSGIARRQRRDATTVAVDVARPDAGPAHLGEPSFGDTPLREVEMVACASGALQAGA
jgi:EmrB/QacA subfamily drug resistance transporter